MTMTFALSSCSEIMRWGNRRSMRTRELFRNFRRSVIPLWEMSEPFPGPNSYGNLRVSPNGNSPVRRLLGLGALVAARTLRARDDGIGNDRHASRQRAMR